MKNSLILIISVFGISLYSFGQLSDDFNGAFVDTNRWNPETLWFNSALQVTNGEAIFINRGDLTSKADIPPVVWVEGRVRLTGSDHDVFNVRMRSGPDVASSHNCVIAQFAIRDNDFGPNGINNIAIYDYSGAIMVKANYPFVMNQYYTFWIFDTATNLTIFLENTNSPVLSLAITNRSGFKLGLNNREGVGSISRGSVSRLDYIRAIDPRLPRLTINVAAVGLNFFAASNSLYAIQASTDNLAWSNKFIIQGVGADTNVMDLVGLQRQFYRVAKLDLTTGLAADFPFNGNANDESGNGNHGTVTDAVLTADRLGNPNSAYSFNGTSSVITIPDSLSLRIPGDLTVVCWVKLFGLSGNTRTRFVGKGSDCFRNYGVWADVSFNWLFQQFSPAGGCVGCQENTLATSPAVGTGNWYQIVGVRNGNQSRLYLNAQLLVDDDNQSQNCSPSTYTGPEPLLIGAPGYSNPQQNLQYANGLIDDVRIYNRALTEAEIQYLYSH